MSQQAAASSAPVLLAPATGSGAARLDFIDGLRGIAMLMVLLFHTWTFGGNWHLPVTLGGHTANLGPIFKLGSTGVSLFLALSGFCLYWPFVSGGRREPTLREFAQKRAHRILPPYYIALILFVVWENVRLYVLAWGKIPDDLPNPVISFVLHALMLHNLRSEYFFDTNGSFWSLALESQLYVLFPLFVEAFRRWNKHLIVFGVFLATCAFRYAAWKAGGGGEANDAVNVLTYSVFGRAFEFALGMFAAWRVAEHRRGEKLLRPMDIALIAVPFVLSLAATRWHYGEVVKAALTGCFYITLLLAAVSPRSIIHRILSARAIVYLGVISYSVYLIHHPFTALIGDTAHRMKLPDSELAMLGLLFTVPFVLAVGAIYFRFCEQPFLNAQARKKARAQTLAAPVTVAPAVTTSLPAPMVAKAETVANATEASS